MIKVYASSWPSLNQINHDLSRRGGSSDNSYDIVKAHGGKIKVETEEGEGSEFIIQLRSN